MQTRAGGGQLGTAPSAKERAYQHLKRAILDGTAAGGGFISEERVASELALSRTPVREAFLRLEAESLLELVPRKGAFVRPISDREVSDVMEARLAIEVFATGKLGPGQASVAADLARLLDAQVELAQKMDIERFIECDRRFHSMIVGAARNAVLSQLYESLRDRQLQMGLRAVIEQPQRVEQVLAEHRRIVSAFEAGDSAGAQDALVGHLGTTLRVLLDRSGASP